MRLLHNSANILYSDGRDFSIYRMGELVRSFSISGDPRNKGEKAVNIEDEKEFEILIRDFLSWEPIVPSNSAQLVEYLAPLCRALRDDVLDALKNNVPEVRTTANDWRRCLFPGADDFRFADAYAQTVTFALLLARSNGSDTLFLDEAIASLPRNHGIPAYCYVVCDLTPTMIKRCKNFSLTMTTDGMGFFGYNPNYKAYIEVISFNQLVKAAKERNRAFFDKLGLPCN